MTEKFYCVKCKHPQEVHDVEKYRKLKNGAQMYAGIDRSGHKLYKIKKR